MILLAIVTALAPTAAVLVSNHYQNKRLNEIHVLVNSRLSEALTEIAALKAQLKGGKDGS